MSVEARHRGRATERAIKLERQLARVRWFGVGFGVFQILGYTLTAEDPGQALDTTPGFLRPANFALLAVFAIVNVVVMVTLRRTNRPRAVARLGHFVFAADTLVLLGMAWAFAFDRYETTWVMFYILTLEGALRYQLRGAVLPVLLAFPSELARSLFREAHYDYPFFFTSVTYRVGIMAIVAAVAGIMARALEREREQAEALAARESVALAELSAFHDVVLAGVTGGNFEDTIKRLVDAMARTLGYDVFAIGLVEVGQNGPQLRCAGARGHPEGSLGRTLALGAGVCGRVADRGVPILVGDTANESEYSEWVPGVRSEACVPITSGGRVIGIIDVESYEPNAFTQTDVERLERLAPQIGLVVSNARLLAQERAMVSRLRELDTMKDDFIAITSHELRSPLTSIRGFVGTLRRKEVMVDDNQRDEYLAVIDRQTERLSRLVEDLLIASRIERGTLGVLHEPVDVMSAIRSVVSALGAEADRVRMTAPSVMPLMSTDEQRLEQIARNLLENALKFSPAAEPVELDIAFEDGRFVMVVRDAGVGISNDEIGRIFDRFYQVGGSMGRHARGVGLGLYITKWLVEALGGTISVTSAPGRGTTFTVLMPLEVAPGQSRRDAIA